MIPSSLARLILREHLHRPIEGKAVNTAGDSTRFAPGPNSPARHGRLRCSTLEDMPSTYRDGSVFLSLADSMNWCGPEIRIQIFRAWRWL